MTQVSSLQKDDLGAASPVFFSTTRWQYQPTVSSLRFQQLEIKAWITGLFGELNIY